MRVHRRCHKGRNKKEQRYKLICVQTTNEETARTAAAMGYRCRKTISLYKTRVTGIMDYNIIHKAEDYGEEYKFQLKRDETVHTRVIRSQSY